MAISRYDIFKLYFRTQKQAPHYQENSSAGGSMSVLHPSEVRYDSWLHLSLEASLKHMLLKNGLVEASLLPYSA